MSAARSGLAVAVGADGRIYAVGGVDATLSDDRGGLHADDQHLDIRGLDADRAQWSRCRNRRRWSHLRDRRGKYAGAPISTVEAYTPATNSWTAAASMPTARNGLAAVTGTDGRIYAMGGGDGAGGRLNTVEAYTPSNTWATMSPMPTARQDFAASAGPDGRIYVMGGVDNTGNDTNAVDVFSPATNSWATVAPLPTLRYGLAAATGPDGRVYAIGGFGGPGISTLWRPTRQPAILGRRRPDAHAARRARRGHRTRRAHFRHRWTGSRDVVHRRGVQHGVCIADANSDDSNLVVEPVRGWPECDL